jgi:hypothetical protein
MPYNRIFNSILRALSAFKLPAVAEGLTQEQQTKQ